MVEDIEDNNLKIPRRKFLGIAAGLGATAITGLGIYEAVNWLTKRNESLPTPKELEGLDRAISTFVNQDADSTFWQRLQKFTSGVEKPNDHFIMWHTDTWDSQYKNCTTFNYYHDRIGAGKQSLQAMIIEPDGERYLSTVVMVNLILGQDGGLKSKILSSPTVDLTLEQIRQKTATYFKEPAILRGTQWDNYSSKHERFVEDKNSGFSYRESAYTGTFWTETGSITLTVWYPKADTTPHFIPNA